MDWVCRLDIFSNEPQLQTRLALGRIHTPLFVMERSWMGFHLDLKVNLSFLLQGLVVIQWYLLPMFQTDLYKYWWRQDKPLLLFHYLV
uniref:Uncharacterized protein n=1 Tax=uncultured marine virus TaxID=186617 RepID=A0A0F7LBZ1_9VIRU|nr:hypothetical protein [uncultured marine virus]